jgi:hypothetical protein
VNCSVPLLSSDAEVGEMETEITGGMPVPERGIVRDGLEAFEVIETPPLAAPADVGAKMTLNIAVWPAFKVSGVLSPLRLKPDPLTPVWEIVTLEPPELFRVTDWLLLLPTMTFAKLTLEGFAPTRPGVIAVPMSGMFKFGLVALLTMAIFPVDVPAEVGAKVTLKVVLWPAVKVVGSVNPLRLNPLPVAVACEIVTVDPLELLRAALSVCLLLTCSGPKFRLDGFDVSDPAARPVPERGRLRVGFDASLVMFRFPLALPIACGAKVTVNVVLWPAMRVSGNVGPPRLNPAPFTTALEITTLLEPVLVMVADWFWLAPSCTLPKLRLAVGDDNWPGVLEEPPELLAWELLAALTPTHPTIAKTKSRTIPPESARERDWRSVNSWPLFVGRTREVRRGIGAIVQA